MSNRVLYGSVEERTQPSGPLVRLVQVFRNSNHDRSSRITAHGLIALGLSIGWFLVTIWGRGYQFRDAAVLAGLVFVVVSIVVTFALRGNHRETIKLAGLRVGVVFLWTVVMVVFAADPNRPWWHYAAVGIGMIVISSLAGLLLPTRLVEVEFGQVYFVPKQSGTQSEFILESRPEPDISEDTIDVLVAAGLKRKRIDRFIRSGGHLQSQKQVRRELKTLLAAASEAKQQQVEEALRTLIGAASRRQFFWCAPVANVWLMWNTFRDQINVQTQVEKVLTKDALLNVTLKFSGLFDPQGLHDVYNYRIPDWKSAAQIKSLFEEMLANVAAPVVRAYFVGHSYDEAVKVGASLEDTSSPGFKRFLIEKLAWTREYLGMTIEDYSIYCEPRIGTTIEDAMERRLASQLATEAEVDRIDKILNKVHRQGKDGLPPEYVAQLLPLLRESNDYHYWDGTSLQQPGQPQAGQDIARAESSGRENTPGLKQPPAPAPKRKRKDRAINLGDLELSSDQDDRLN